MWRGVLACDHSFNVPMRLTGGHIHIMIKGAGHGSTWQEVQVGHVQEHTLNLSAGGGGKGGGAIEGGCMQ
jgi:hypothetical protein